MIDIRLTYFENMATKERVYTVPEAVKWLKKGEKFFMVGVTPYGEYTAGSTRVTSPIKKIEQNIVTTSSGGVYSISGIDKKRFVPTKIELESFVVSRFFTVTDINEIPNLIAQGLIVCADFKDEDGTYGTTGPIVNIDLENRRFTTKSEHTYTY